MRLPFTIDGRDVVADVVDEHAPVDELATAALGGAVHAPVVVAGRTVPGATTIGAAGLRPGVRLTAQTREPAPRRRHGLAVHVVAGVDSGRVVELLPPPPQPPGPNSTPPAGQTANEYVVGRDAGADVVLASPAISKAHCVLAVDGDPITGGTVRIRDAGSKNGTFVGARRLDESWTTLTLGVPVRVGPAAIVVRRVAAADPPAKVAELLEHAATGPVPFYRSPVDLVGAGADEVPVPAPPRRPKTGRPGLIGFLLPMILAAVMVRVTGQIFYAMFALMGPVILLMNLADRAGRNRRIRRKSKRRFATELVEFRRDLDEIIDYEVTRRRAMHPDLAELARRAVDASATLWDRRPGHPQFLHLAVGVGDLEWEVPLGDVGSETFDHPELAAAVDGAGLLRLAPLALPLTTGTTIGLAGERRGTLATARGVLLQAAVHHGPAELRLVLVTHRRAAADWDWVKWLPHVRPSSFGEGRMLVVVSDDDGRLDGGALDDVLADAESGAALLVVIDTAGLADAGDLAVRRLLRKGGARSSGIVVAPQADGLPDLATVVIDHHDTIGEATVRWPAEGGRTVDIVIGGADLTVAETAARALARFSDPDAGGGSATLPARIGLAEVLGLEGATATDLTNRWTLRGQFVVPVGRSEGGTAAIGLGDAAAHLAVVGGRGSGKSEALAAMVLAIAASYPPSQVHFVLWGESFGPFGRLPHTANAINRVDENTVNLIIEGLDRELTRRERSRTRGEPGDDEPRLIVVVDDVDTIVRLVPKGADDLVRLLRRARGLNVHVIWSTGRSIGGAIADLIDLSPVRLALRLATAPESVDLIGTEAAAQLERSLPGRGYLAAGGSDPREVQGALVSTGLPTGGGELEAVDFALRRQIGDGSVVAIGEPDERTLGALISAAGSHYARPSDLLSASAAAATALESPGLLELLGVGGPEGLSTLTENWQTRDTDQFLRVPIGVDPEVRPVVLDLRESALAGMGPHGLLVGATGSGKSELLRTLVSGLAATHSPELLAFVLVDFKGGASFSSYGKLPHVAGVVTNLADDLALVDRILAALGGEQRRRQELLAAAGNLGNVREYRAARLNGTLPAHLENQPLPQLLVIVDEFAELLDQEPAFIDFFLTIGRVGRSLGIHLLLASQRLEEGKLRGVDTYLSYRLGLRTFNASESRIVLGVPDAFSLPSAPGGGYLKVGSTAFERFQASYVSGPIDAADPDGPSVMEAIVDELHERGGAKVHQIWLPPLEHDIALSDLFEPGGFVHDPERGFAAARWPRSGGLAVPVGVVDEPELQRQLPLVLDFAGAHGNLAIVGAPQSGKSAFLRTLALSLAITHTPDEVQIYVADFGGGTLEALSRLPHVGAVAARLEPERVARLIAHVESVVNRREALFRERGIDSVATFRELRAKGELPADAGGDVFLLIDNWIAFREKLEGLEPTIADLAARGLGYGVHVVITANRWLEMRSTVVEPIGGRLELRMNNSADSNIDRRKSAVIRADQPGRGLHPSKRMFHIALPRLDGAASSEQLQAATLLAVDNIASRWSGAAATPIRLLPQHFDLADLEAALNEAGDPPRRTGVGVGLQEAGMQPWVLDLETAEPHFFVYGDGESGKTTLLRTWLTRLCAARTREQVRVILVDYRRTLLEVVPPTHLAGYAASEPAAREIVAALVAELEARLPGAEVTPRQLRERSWWSGPDVYVVVDDYDLVVNQSGNPLQPLLPYLAQGRDLGLHVVLARRVAGSTKSAYEAVTARIREVSPVGVLLSGDRDEGVILGGLRAVNQPPGRGILVQRRQQPTLVQVADTPPPDDDEPDEPTGGEANAGDDEAQGTASSDETPEAGPAVTR